jgi:hypothetical protein
MTHKKSCLSPDDEWVYRLMGGPRVEPPVEAPARSSARRMLRAARLCEDLGHGSDILAALEHMKRMERALKVLRTWASFPPMDVRHVKDLCDSALNMGERLTPKLSGRRRRSAAA